MRAIAELASSLIAGFGTVAARAAVMLAPDTLIAEIANKPARSAAFPGFMRPPCRGSGSLSRPTLVRSNHGQYGEGWSRVKGRRQGCGSPFVLPLRDRPKPGALTPLG